MKRQPIEWEKIFANDVTNQGFYLQNTQTVQAAQYQKRKKKWAEDLNRHFCKEICICVYIYTYIKLNYFSVHLKLTQLCKSTILQ